MRSHVSGIVTGLLILVFGAVFAVVGWLGMAEVRPYDDGITTSAEVVGNVEGTVIVAGGVPVAGLGALVVVASLVAMLRARQPAPLVAP